MLLFQLPQREAKYVGTLPEQGPYQVELSFQLGPLDFFGEADISGKLREFPEFSDIKLDGTFFDGMKRPSMAAPGRMPEFKLSGAIYGTQLTIAGSVARVRFGVGNLEILETVLQRLIEFIPAAFSGASTTAVFISDVFGTIDGLPLKVQLFGDTIHGHEAFFVGDVASKVEKYFQLLGQMGTNVPRKLISAHRYLAQSFHLEAASSWPYQFTGERLLNLCKALESVLDGKSLEKIDEMRSCLQSWGVHPDYVEVFASIKYLRNELDVGHIARTPITPEGRDRVVAFVGLAEKCVQALLHLMAKNVIEDSNFLHSEPTQVADPPVVTALKKYEKLQGPSDGDITKI